MDFEFLNIYVNLWLTTRYLFLFTCSTIMVFFLFRSLSLSLVPIFPAISFIFSLINNSSQFVLGLISSFREFSSECFLPGEIRIVFHFFVHFSKEFLKAYTSHVNWQVLLQISMSVLE